jgi:Asp-tRNA(Asn)/Glu-tRNA(Gln) amidotransferase A subunit family amidase
VIAGSDDRDRLSIRSDDVDWRRAVDGDLRGTRVAYSADLEYAAVDPEVRSVVDRAVTVFERDLGCTVERADPNDRAMRSQPAGVVGLTRAPDGYHDRRPILYATNSREHLWTR